MSGFCSRSTLRNASSQAFAGYAGPSSSARPKLGSNSKAPWLECCKSGKGMANSTGRRKGCLTTPQLGPGDVPRRAKRALGSGPIDSTMFWMLYIFLNRKQKLKITWVQIFTAFIWAEMGEHVAQSLTWREKIQCHEIPTIAEPSGCTTRP